MAARKAAPVAPWLGAGVASPMPVQRSAVPTVPSPVRAPGRLVAWGEDTSGNEKYTLRVHDIATGEPPWLTPAAAGRCVAPLLQRWRLLDRATPASDAELAFQQCVTSFLLHRQGTAG